MTRDDIIRMAREAGGSSGGIWGFTVIELERFFKLAYEAGAAAEREACAKLAESTHPHDWGFIAVAIRARGEKR
jgi:MoaA/NifB/PqqE/SkfB family radical SAM enzyme